MEVTVALAWWTLLVGVPLNVIAAYLLWHQSRKAPSLRVLRERFLVSVATTIVVLFFGLIFVNNDREVPWLSLDATKLITRTAMLGLAFISAGGWLWLYLTSKRSERSPSTRTRSSDRAVVPLPAGRDVQRLGHQDPSDPS